jgi:hypothetical protein
VPLDRGAVNALEAEAAFTNSRINCASRPALLFAAAPGA